jgi:uncharacterized protein
MDDFKQSDTIGNTESTNTAGMSQDEKNWGMFCHVAVFAGCIVPLGNIVGPLVIWLMKKDQYGFVDYNARQAMNFQITFFIAMLGGLLLSFVLIGILMMIGFGIFALVATIKAIMASSRGEYYSYPCSIQFIR